MTLSCGYIEPYVTKDGKEMGRAQVAQAEAAGLEPMVDKDPVLLKPTGNSLKAFGAVTDALARLQKNFDTLVIEGAGSPAVGAVMLSFAISPKSLAKAGKELYGLLLLARYKKTAAQEFCTAVFVFV